MPAGLRGWQLRGGYTWGSRTGIGSAASRASRPHHPGPHRPVRGRAFWGLWHTCPALRGSWHTSPGRGPRSGPGNGSPPGRSVRVRAAMTPDAADAAAMTPGAAGAAGVTGVKPAGGHSGPRRSGDTGEEGAHGRRRRADTRIPGARGRSGVLLVGGGGRRGGSRDRGRGGGADPRAVSHPGHRRPFLRPRSGGAKRLDGSGGGAAVRVLVIEDDEELAEAIAAGLRQERMAVDVAVDGSAGLDHALFTDYDVIVLDRDLPGRHGDEVCAELVRAGGRS